jgi:DeoR/GlpR family transcriptional regulator of sugar metabolism
MGGKPQGLITSQARILAVIYLDQEASFTEIAGRLKIDEKTVREGIAALEKQGYVIRTKHRGHRNRYEIDKHRQITGDSAASAYRLAELLAVNAYPEIRPPDDL